MRRRLLRLLLMGLLACVSAGCTFNHGSSAEDWRLATMPRGRIVTVRLHPVGDTAAAAYTGELLEVRDSSLIVLADEVIAANFRGVRRIVVKGAMPMVPGSSREDYRRGRPGTYLRRFSRYPYGAPAEVMHQILRDHGQTELRGVTP